MRQKSNEEQANGMEAKIQRKKKPYKTINRQKLMFHRAGKNVKKANNPAAWGRESIGEVISEGNGEQMSSAAAEEGEADSKLWTG